MESPVTEKAIRRIPEVSVPDKVKPCGWQEVLDRVIVHEV
jgi:hypothetical protein